jgi:hypothetical protein
VSLSQGGACLSCPGSLDLGVLLPYLAGVIVEAVTAAAGLLLVTARARAPEAACPGCGTVSHRVQGSGTHPGRHESGGQPTVRLRERGTRRRRGELYSCLTRQSRSIALTDCRAGKLVLLGLNGSDLGGGTRT